MKRLTPKFKAYFYNGFDKPKLLATSVTGLERNVKITDSFMGDRTSDIRLEVRCYKNGQNTFEEFCEYLEDFNIYIDPNFEKLIGISHQWFLKGREPLHHFEDFR